MNKIKKQNGITLIALIITIIVLLILAVVTIGAIKNDGIIQHAKEAKDDYQQAQAEEEDILFGYLDDIEKSTWSVPSELETYALGKNKTGRPVSEVSDISVSLDVSTNMYKYDIIPFKDDPTTELNESEAIKFLNLGWDETMNKMFAYVKYDNAAYKVVFNRVGMEPGSTESISVIYVPQGREGTTVQYDSNGDGKKEDWIILTDRNGKVEIVSAGVMKDKNGEGLTIGSGDTSVTTKSDLNGNGTSGDSVDIAIASYNNAITRVNNFCKSIVTATDNKGVRSIGGTQNDVAPYSSTNFKNWFNGKESVASGDTQYEEDLVKLSYWDKTLKEDYWVASRQVFGHSAFENFLLRFVYERKLNGNGIWMETSYDYGRGYSVTRPVRPVVINPAGI